MRVNEGVLQNLEDAGCGRELVSQYQKLSEQALSEQIIRRQQTQLLRGYRKTLIDLLHEDQRKIDCLDHLLYRLQTEES